MPRSTDAREKVLETAERLFRTQGFAATGLAQILDESGAPKGSYYHHFPGGKAQMAEEALVAYAARGDALIAYAAERAHGDPSAFVRTLASAFATEMERSDWTLGCMAQNLAGELAPGDAVWTERVGQVFARWSSSISAAFRTGGLDKRRADALATTLLASLEGARSLARVERSAKPFLRIIEVLTPAAQAA